MRCAQAHKLIGDQLEGVISAVDSAKLQKHIAECADCRDLLNDFKDIADAARKLPRREPSARVWTGVLTGVGLSGREPARGRALGPNWLERFFLQGRARTVWAAALVLTVVAGGIVIGLRSGRGPVSALSPEDKYALSKLEEAGKHYVMAIDALQEAISSQKAKLDPEIFAAFARNLGAIDGVIRSCRKAVDANPTDLSARAYLLDAYKQKVEFLGSVIDVTKGASPAKPAGAQIL
jgi:predicted anti-sigma-YlaC factor YlaD